MVVSRFSVETPVGPVHTYFNESGFIAATPNGRKMLVANRVRFKELIGAIKELKEKELEYRREAGKTTYGEQKIQDYVVQEFNKLGVIRGKKITIGKIISAGAEGVVFPLQIGRNRLVIKFFYDARTRTRLPVTSVRGINPALTTLDILNTPPIRISSKTHNYTAEISPVEPFFAVSDGKNFNAIIMERLPTNITAHEQIERKYRWIPTSGLLGAIFAHKYAEADHMEFQMEDVIHTLSERNYLDAHFGNLTIKKREYKNNTWHIKLKHFDLGKQHSLWVEKVMTAVQKARAGGLE